MTAVLNDFSVAEKMIKPPALAENTVHLKKSVTRPISDF